jgi:hypothetical protein
MLPVSPSDLRTSTGCGHSLINREDCVLGHAQLLPGGENCAFVVIGALLLAAAYGYHRQRNRRADAGHRIQQHLNPTP